MACRSCSGKTMGTRVTPALLGVQDGSAARKVITTVGIMGIPRGAKAWVTGSLVQSFLSNGSLRNA